VADHLLDAVAAAAAEASALAMKRWRDDFRRWEKQPGELVSEIDLEIDAMLRDRLMAIDAAAGWLSEETADNADRLACDKLWVVDPIDGTRDYLRRRPGWAVSVALIEQGVPVLGVLEAPARGETWLAAAGKGAFRNGKRLRASERTLVSGARVPTDSLPRADRDLVAVAKPNSIALRMAMVAADEADLVATLRWGHEWDVAAATLIVREAGGVATDARGAPLVFNTPRACAFGVLASAQGIHMAAVERLAERARVLAGEG